MSLIDEWERIVTEDGKRTQKSAVDDLALQRGVKPNATHFCLKKTGKRPLHPDEHAIMFRKVLPVVLGEYGINDIDWNTLAARLLPPSCE
jgi:hypothetical protein